MGLGWWGGGFLGKIEGGESEMSDPFPSNKLSNFDSFSQFIACLIYL
jgi:hypothetical protein